MQLDGHTLTIDYRTELEQYDWRRATWKPEKLIACSPFRYESSPSFYVYLEDTESASAGNWQDSGSSDGEYGKGGFVKLLAFLRGETEAQTIEYLLETYASGYVPEEKMTLKPHPRFGLEKPKEMSKDRLKALAFRHPYLEGRGISEAVQRAYGIGYDAERKAISIPWIDSKKRLITIKYRSVTDKKFWYDAEGVDITSHLFGMHLIYKEKPKRVVLVEAEIDAMYLRTAGIAAVATGNRYFSKHRADILRKAGFDELVIGADQDAAGTEMRERVIKALSGEVELLDWELPPGHKDINDVKSLDEVRLIVAAAEPLPTRGIRLL